MTNRTSSKQHGLAGAERMRPKSKLSKRGNKRKAMDRKAEKNAAWQEMIKGS